jgi:hypothetical protein
MMARRHCYSDTFGAHAACRTCHYCDAERTGKKKPCVERPNAPPQLGEHPATKRRAAMKLAQATRLWPRARAK